jgi:hypothetical protein
MFSIFRAFAMTVTLKIGKFFDSRSEKVVILEIPYGEHFGNSGCDGFCLALILALLARNSHALYTVYKCAWVHIILPGQISG